MAYLYPYGDTQQLNLDWLIEQWNEVKSQIDGSLQAEIDRVEAAITDLLTARDEAVAAQTAAQASAQAAAGSASTASGAASTATAQAQAAAASAATAGAHASDAQQYMLTADQYAQAAQNSAGAAANSANTANGAKQDAQMYAQQASGSAQNAAGSATAAQQQFNLADAARQAAQGYASDAADSAQDAQDILDSIPEDYSAAVADITHLKENATLNTLSQQLLSQILVPDGSKATNNQANCERVGNIIKLYGGASSSTYRNTNITGSAMKMRNGQLANFTVYDTDFVSAAIFRKFYATASLNSLTPIFTISAVSTSYTYIRGNIVKRSLITDPDTGVQNYVYSRNQFLGGINAVGALNLWDNDDTGASLGGARAWEEFAIYITTIAQPVTRDFVVNIEFDLKTPILAETIENNLTALSQHAQGDVFYRGRRLAQAIAPIAVNENLALNTNYKIISINDIIQM